MPVRNADGAVISTLDSANASRCPAARQATHAVRDLRRLVPSMPTLSITSLATPRRGSLPRPLDGTSVSFWFSARTALWQAIRGLRLKAGDRVAVPAFCCGSELEPFLHAGIELRFFGVTSDLNPEPGSFEAAIEEAQAALVTHYFGFPADLGDAAAACRKRGIPLIEDCAHALYSRIGSDAAGEKGDAAVFSLWKTVALPDGGALRIGTGPGVLDECQPPPPGIVAANTRRLVSHHWQAGAWPLRGAALVASCALAFGRSARRRQSMTASPYDPAYELIRFRAELARTAMSERASRLFRAADHDGIRRVRRQRYREIGREIEGLPGITPLFGELRPGACPLFFPVVVHDPAPLRRAFAARQIGVKHIWPWFHPRVPWDRFARERALKASVLGLPVHQSLRDSDVARLVETLRRHAGA